MPNNMRKLLLILSAISASASAANINPDAAVYNLSANIDNIAKTLDVAVELSPEDYSLSRDAELILTPVIYSSTTNDSIALDPVVLCGRNRYFYHLRRGEIDRTDTNIYRAGTPGVVTIAKTIPLEPWMDRSTIELRQDAATCCNMPDLVKGASDHGATELAVIDRTLPQLADIYVYSPSVDAAPVTRNIEGRAFVSFVVNKTDLRPDYMVNRREIAKITKSIDIVREDPDATIVGIRIKGFASPEGSYANNVRLAQGRTATLSRYVRDLYSFPDSIVANSYEPEDWQGLRCYVADSLDFDIEHRAEILDIIDSPLDPDTKDASIKRRFPADYKVILKEIYPWLRHSDYTVRYQLRVYTSLDELNRVYATDATRLRPVDFYTIAAQYREGSDEYLAVMRRAVEVYPDDAMLNLNAANAAMLDGDYDTAQSHLLRAGRSPQADFARGVLAARRGDRKTARQYFNTALDAGISQADAYIQSLDIIDAHHSITITHPLTKEIKQTNQ